MVLAAGFGTRLQPLTHLRPKPLCPVDNVALVDHAIARLEPLVDAVAVNAHHHAAMLREHLGDRDVHLSVEEPEPLGTAGAVGNLRDWIAGRAVVVANSDTWYSDPIDTLLDGWDGERIRLVVHDDAARADFDGWRFVGTSVMPWPVVDQLPAAPSGLWEVSWGAEHAAGRLDLVRLPGRFVACDTPRDYLEANLAASGGASVVAGDAVVEGDVVRSVVWPGAVVRRGERLVEVVRAGTSVEPLTVDAAQ